MQWMTYWRMFSSRSLGAELPKNVLLISSSPSSHVGWYLLGTWTLLLSVFRRRIAPLLREAKWGNPYSRKTPKKGRSSRAGANDGSTTAKEHNAPCLRAFVSSHPTVAPKETTRRSIVRSSAFSGYLSASSVSSTGARR